MRWMMTWGCAAAVLFAAGMAGAESELDEGVAIRAGEKLLEVQVGHTAPFVCDWNGDGRLDLLVGDYSVSSPPKRVLSDDDEFLRIGLEAERQALQRKMGPISQQLARSVLEAMGVEVPSEGGFGEAFGRLTEEQRAEYGKRMQEAFPKHAMLKVLQARMAEVHGELGELQGRPQVRGHIWLFLRKAPAAATGGPSGG